MNANKHFDIIAIGDTVIDAFIKLKDAEVHCDIKHEDCQLCLPFGGKVPYEDVYIVPGTGNSANAAISFAKLGLHSALISSVGDDQNGDNCLKALREAGVDTAFVRREHGKKTNYHYVLWYGDERTILVKHEKFAHSLPAFGEPEWIYLSSLGENTEKIHEEILEYLKTHPKVKLAFQPGTFQIKAGYGKMAPLYRRTEIFFCNRVEAKKILGTDKDGCLDLAKLLTDLGPKTVVVTDADRGAWAHTAGKSWFIPTICKKEDAIERTGAGDAFASAVVSALAQGEDLENALCWGPVNADSVIRFVGPQAGLLNKKELLKRVSELKNFKLKELK